MSTILLTGVTGVVGSRLAQFLREKGHQLICLVRSKPNRPAYETAALEGVTVWDGDITIPNCGVSTTQIAFWKGKIDKLVNCAASVKFDDSAAELIIKTNVDGIINVLALAKALGIMQIHQVSTAYVAGDADRFTEDDFDIGQAQRNVYERTKTASEGIIRYWVMGQQPNARYSIYRIGVVVGDSVTGYIPTFNGYYGFLASIWQLKRDFSTMPDARRKEYEAAGITLDGTGLLHLPVWGNFSSASTLNLVPRDWTCKILSELVSLNAKNMVFHVVDPNPNKVRWINDVSLKHINVAGFLYQAPDNYDPKSPLGRFQKMFDRVTNRYAAYITHEAKFEVRNIFKVLGEDRVPPLKLDENFFITIVNYAKSVDFGKKAK